MIAIRPSKARGHFNHGWLDTYHSFSFAEYYDPAFESFRTLRVLNEDRVAPGRGFPTHGHRDMEIITCVVEGALEHSDSLGNGSVIRPGDVQRMSAGTGVLHSEKNPSDSEPLHLLQIWILPERNGMRPGYEQKMFSPEERTDKLRLIGSRDGRDGSVTIHQDVDLYGALLDGKENMTHSLRPGRHGWIQIVKGSVDLNGHSLGAGDGAAVSEERELTFRSSGAEILLFDLA